MENREPVVAGRFYDDNPETLRRSIAQYFADLAPAKPADSATKAPAQQQGWSEHQPLLILLPHAGHVFCGPVIAATLQDVELARRLLILCPSHTGQGADLGYWPSGFWRTPLGQVQVDQQLGQELHELDPDFRPDIRPHLGEHSIEVLLPFVQFVAPESMILPVVVKQAVEPMRAAEAIAQVIRRHPGEVGIIVSSDLNHYASDAQNRKLDALAIDALLQVDAQLLAKVVQRDKISMCGVWPAILGLLACRLLGAGQSKLMAYDTSATASSDASRVVGYAGLKIW